MVPTCPDVAIFVPHDCNLRATSSWCQEDVWFLAGNLNWEGESCERNWHEVLEIDLIYFLVKLFYIIGRRFSTNFNISMWYLVYSHTQHDKKCCIVLSEKRKNKERSSLQINQTKLFGR